MKQSDRVIGNVDGYVVVDIFPYRIKNLQNFIFRDHIPYKEGDVESEDYALDIWRWGIEGLWVNDNGTWVFMMPKLFFFANLSTVMAGAGKSRKPRYPDVTVIEWIIFSYVLYCDGFSGFMDDPEYTCNLYVRDILEGAEVPAGILKNLDKYCKKADGTWKTYVNAWEFLTYTYLVGDPRPFPLGKPLYENDSYNGMMMATRGGHKTYDLSAGDCSQELWTGGAMYVEDLLDNPRFDGFMGSSDTEYMKTFIETLELSLTNVPGGNHGFNSLLTKTFTGNWDPDRGSIKHEFRKDDGSYEGTGSQLSKAVIQINKPQVVVSKRAKRIWVDECGLQGNLIAVHGAADATLKSPEGKFGVLMMSGTGGNVAKIVENKTMYYDPNRFQIASIPNYWFDNKPIGLFIPASYKWAMFQDENGNVVDLIAATKHVLKERNLESGGDITKQTTRRMNEPLNPEEIFLTGEVNQFNTDLILNRIDALRRGPWKAKAKVYELQLGAFLGELYDVKVAPIDDEFNHVVTEYIGQEKQEGRLVIYELPKGDGREFLPYNNLYKVVLDPKTDLETGESFHKVIVWKGLPQRGLEPDEMFFNIVAEAKVKEDGLLIALLLCLLYKARMQYERNVSGIPDFFDKYGLRGLLQPTPLAYIRDIIPGSKQVQQSGIHMNEQLKKEGLRLLRKLHNLIVHEDITGRKVRMVETWWDLSLLYEMNYYDKERNFDSVSAMIILALWLESEYIPEESRRQQEDPESDSSWDDLAQTAKRILA